MIRTEDHGRVRVMTLDRPERLNAFNDALYHAATAALRDAAGAFGTECVTIHDKRLAVSLVITARSARSLAKRGVYLRRLSAARSSALGCQSPAAAFERTCSGFVAPELTDATAG